MKTRGGAKKFGSDQTLFSRFPIDCRGVGQFQFKLQSLQPSGAEISLSPSFYLLPFISFLLSPSLGRPCCLSAIFRKVNLFANLAAAKSSP
jgi:hypothetical protein